MGGAGGAALNASGALGAEAVMTARRRLEPAMGEAETLTLQIDDVGKLVFLAIDASLRDGSVQVGAEAASMTALSGPLLLFGAGVSLFADDLSTLSVRNTHATEAATLTILIGSALTDPEP